MYTGKYGVHAGNVKKMSFFVEYVKILPELIL
jgi:hypothetical protein